MREKMFRKYKKKLRRAASGVNEGLLRHMKRSTKLVKNLLTAKIENIDTAKFRALVKGYEDLAKMLLKK